MSDKVYILDIGNTNTRCSLYDGGKFIEIFRKRTRDIYADDIPYGLPIAAASVVPWAKDKLKRDDIFYVSNQCNLGIDLSLVDSDKLGPDRIANLAALKALSALPAAVIDVGTAITLEALDEKGVFVGGIIAPGRELQRKALGSYTAALPYIPVSGGKTYKSFGRDTEDSIILGTDYGVIGAVKEFMSVTRREMKTDKVSFLVAGGDAAILAKNIPELKVVPKEFTLIGVLEIWKINKQ
ncbi:MAG TPA: hypothetical protein DD381_00080 [Lentisphaeria bacterium]|nr:MAG: hypothetical protein A2X47_12890 [Lentisphaerae bacterium GWF2_38_69]HBM14739.1 hypothetical protein [Lentisphaeria bacterium]